LRGEREREIVSETSFALRLKEKPLEEYAGLDALLWRRNSHRLMPEVDSPGVWYKLVNFWSSYFTEMWSGSETGPYLRLIDFVYHSTLGLRVIKKN